MKPSTSVGTRTAALAVTLLAGVIAHGAAAAQAGALRPGDVVLRGGWIFDGVRDDVVRNRAVIARGGKLLAVGADLAGADLAAARVIELGDDDYILPGLFDLHAHYAIDLFGEGRIDEQSVYPQIFLANGVTSTFPGGEMDPVSMRATRLRIAAGEQVGARIHGSGPYFGSARPGWNAAAMTPDSIRAEVDYWAGLGTRGFKAKGIRAEQLAPLVERAHRHGLTVTGHLDSGFRNSVNPRDAILMGIDRIEHFIGGDAIAGDRPAYASLEALDAARPEVRAAIRSYIEHGVYFDATLTAYGYYGEREPAVFDYWFDERTLFTPHAQAVVKQRTRRVNAQFERIYHVKRKTIKAFYDEGGGRLITLGTDHPSWGEFVSGFGAHRELHALVLAGIPPAAALKIGTINGARALGLGDRLGTLENGKLADLFVVRGNPLADIRNTRNVRWVMVGGVIHDAPALLRGAVGRIGPASTQDETRWRPTPG